VSDCGHESSIKIVMRRPWPTWRHGKKKKEVRTWVVKNTKCEANRYVISIPWILSLSSVQVFCSTLILSISYYLKLVTQSSHHRKNKGLNYYFYELTYFKKNCIWFTQFINKALMILYD